MRSRFVIPIILLMLGLLTACASAPETPADTVEKPTTIPENDETQPYPYPSSNEIYLPVTGSEPAYPAPEPSDGAIEPYPGVEAPILMNPEKVLKFSDVLPAPEDKKLVSGPAFIESADVDTVESNSSQVQLVVIGNLPTPCHALRMVVSDPDKENKIAINAYSVTDPETMCIQVLEPFSVIVPLKNLEAGKYTVVVNGEQVAEFELP